MGRGGEGKEAAPFREKGGLGGRDFKLSVNDIQETGDEAGMCPHMSGGTPKGVSGWVSSLSGMTAE